MYTLPSVSTATAPGLFRPVNGSTVWSFDPAANFSTRSFPVSVRYTLPAASTATLLG